MQRAAMLVLTAVWLGLSGAVARPARLEPEPTYDDAPAAAAPAKPPSTVAGLLASLTDPELKRQANRLAGAHRKGLEGDYAGGIAIARSVAERAQRVRVTRDQVAPRDTLIAAAQGVAADLQALDGRLADARREWQRLSRLKLTDDFTAQAHFSLATLELLDHNFSAAIAAENQAIRLAKDDVRPVGAPVQLLYQGSAERALEALKPGFEARISGRHAALWAGAAALSLGRLSEAGSYLGRVRGDLASLPVFHLADGLLKAASGDVGGAVAAFGDGARRERGRLKQAGFLAAVAEIATGNAQSGGPKLQQLLGQVPPHYRLIGVDLLADLTAARAATALATPAWWWSLNAYQPGALQQAGGAPATPVEPPPADPPAAPLAEDPAATPPPAADPAPTEQPAPEPIPGVRVMTTGGQGVEAYQAALNLLAARRLSEAEVACRSALELQPRFPEAWYLLGQLQYAREDWRAAGESFGRAVKLSRHWAEAAYAAGLAWRAAGDADQAAAYAAYAAHLGYQPAGGSE